MWLQIFIPIHIKNLRFHIFLSCDLFSAISKNIFFHLQYPFLEDDNVISVRINIEFLILGNLFSYILWPRIHSSTMVSWLSFQVHGRIGPIPICSKTYLYHRYAISLINHEGSHQRIFFRWVAGRSWKNVTFVNFLTQTRHFYNKFLEPNFAKVLDWNIP